MQDGVLTFRESSRILMQKGKSLSSSSSEQALLVMDHLRVDWHRLT